MKASGHCLGGGRHAARPFAVPAPFRAAFLALLLAAAPAHAEAPDTGLCLSCHGGPGQAPATADTPLLGGQPELYALYQLVFFRQGQRKHDVMTELVAEMSDDELRALAAWVGTLPPPAAIEAEVERTALSQERFDRGAELARSHRCGNCHEPDLTGREHMPRLAGQQEAYLLKTLQDYKAGRRVGIQAAMAEVLSDMDEADLEALAHFMAHAGR
ncbi:c-type cytochrome [Marinibaculum pumilum]|uniref:C-type cytochrome n=1 Tax=Marinibaculum pumilum TaxID=1766165 RepID=A0ABV7KVB2_9PROT